MQASPKQGEDWIFSNVPWVGLVMKGEEDSQAEEVSPRCSTGGRMSSKLIYVIFNIVGFFWVGGWGFFMFRYPKFFADFNARFGFKMFSSPKSIAFTRQLGIVEMILAGVSAVSLIVSLIFGFKWY